MEPFFSQQSTLQAQIAKYQLLVLHTNRLLREVWFPKRCRLQKGKSIHVASIPLLGGRAVGQAPVSPLITQKLPKQRFELNGCLQVDGFMVLAALESGHQSPKISKLVAPVTLKQVFVWAKATFYSTKIDESNFQHVPLFHI